MTTGNRTDVLIFEMGKLRLRVVKSLIQGHTANKKQKQASSLLTLKIYTALELLSWHPTTPLS